MSFGLSQEGKNKTKPETKTFLPFRLFLAVYFFHCVQHLWLLKMQWSLPFAHHCKA